MISAIVGVPGCGKTNRAVEIALEYMAAGGAVFTNIRFTDVEPNPDSQSDIDKWRIKPDGYPVRALRMYDWEYQQGQYNFIDLTAVSDDFLKLIPRGSPTKPILLILDEVNEWFDSLDGGKLKGKSESDIKYQELFKFLRLSRHYHVDVIFLLQDFATLHVRLRKLCQYVYRSINLKNLKMPGLPLTLWGFPFFCIVQMTNKGALVRKFLTSHKRWVFKCYDTHAEFGAVAISDAVFNSDFRRKAEAGKAGEDIMNKADRFFVAACCAAVAGVVWFGPSRGTGTYGGAPLVITNTVEKVVGALPEAGRAPASAGSALPAAVVPRVAVEYAPFCFAEWGGTKKCIAGGKYYWKGQRVEGGIVVEVESDYIRIVMDEGRERFIYRSDLAPVTIAENDSTKVSP